MTTQQPLTAFVSFPSPYTQSLITQALVSTIPNLKLSLAPYPEDNPPQLQWADYDLISWDKPHASPSTHQTSSYIYRKALIRKHQLHLTIIEYLAKCDYRGVDSVLNRGGWANGWRVELQFADELDELFCDELYELGEVLKRNEDIEKRDKQWFILKPGFADRAQGIRLFSTEEELRAIFEEFEPYPSDDEEEDDDDEDDDDEEDDEDDEYDEDDKYDEDDDIALEQGSQAGPNSPARYTRQTTSSSIPSPRRSLGKRSSTGARGPSTSGDEEGTGVMTSQLRHFLIQEYLPRPILFDITQPPGSTTLHLSGHKFHLRAYVLLTADYTLHLSKTILALFSSTPYTSPSSSTDTNSPSNLLGHLTNTCLQTDAFGAPTPDADLVKTLWELEGMGALGEGDEGYDAVGVVDRGWLERVFEQVGEVVAESMKAGVECGSFGLQLLPNAFEIFGVDLMLSLPNQIGTGGSVPTPLVTLLEYNASPDFHQSGTRLRRDLAGMFRGVIDIAIKPFFGLERYEEEQGSDVAESDGNSWVLIGDGKVRGPRT